jgi:hypothetical protein
VNRAISARTKRLDLKADMLLKLSAARLLHVARAVLGNDGDQFFRQILSSGHFLRRRM